MREEGLSLSLVYVCVKKSNKKISFHPAKDTVDDRQTSRD